MHALCNTKSYKPDIFLPVGRARLSVCQPRRKSKHTHMRVRSPAQAVLCLTSSPQNKRAPEWHLDGWSGCWQDTDLHTDHMTSTMGVKPPTIRCCWTWRLLAVSDSTRCRASYHGG